MGVSKIVKSQIESNSQLSHLSRRKIARCVKDRQITNWKQFTTFPGWVCQKAEVCQRSSNHKLKAIHNVFCKFLLCHFGVSKIVKSQIESNSQPVELRTYPSVGCVKDRQITNWKQFTTAALLFFFRSWVCQRSSNHKLKAIHNRFANFAGTCKGVSKIVKSQIESNSQQLPPHTARLCRCVKDRQITNWKQFTTRRRLIYSWMGVCQRSSNHKLKAIHNAMW